jgi:UDP-N-acetylglucosamine 2-epimerase (non-hydrolysing)
MRIISVVGTRPNFMKVAPLSRVFATRPKIESLIVHTGQHYDADMSDVFFQQLGIPEPTRSLNVGSGSHAEMTGRVLMEFEKVCLELKPDMVIVVGDVNSTLAGALAARKIHIPVAHVEAGLRSFDETMPEELNRRLTDHLSNLLFATEPAGVENLRREGIEPARVHLVGDIMLETLSNFRDAIVGRKRRKEFGLSAGRYALITMHRPSNVDDPQALAQVVDILESLPCPAIFPIHPRTVTRLERFGLKEKLESRGNVRLTPPQSYVDFLSLMSEARLILSDSGSVQAESAFFDTPCLVARENTERPICLEHGTSELVGRNKERVLELCGRIMDGTYKHTTPEFTAAGLNVAEKIVKVIEESLSTDYAE